MSVCEMPQPRTAGTNPPSGPDTAQKGDARALPRVWCSYRRVGTPEDDMADLTAHGVTCVSCDASTVTEAREALELARRHGMTYHIDLPEITERSPLIEEMGLQPVMALMIGGAYRGRAIDRHLFQFSPGRQRIIVEPPVYHERFAYTRGRWAHGKAPPDEPICHYYPDMPSPVRAEVVVPREPFNGRQHLEIVPAEICPAPPGAVPEPDSVGPDMPPSSEVRDRVLYELSFDLSSMADAMLSHVGIAVYWPYNGTTQYWIFGTGTASAWAESTRQALRQQVRRSVGLWTEANGGTFPSDVVRAARFGDECFYITGHSFAPVVSYPLWDFSAPSIEAFRAAAGDIAYPRTWGFPEVYGADSYAVWLYTLHRGCAELCGLIRDELARLATGLALFRNTTRMGVFDLCNEHDGSGQELLTQNLDVVHLDPYPVHAHGYGKEIPRDMSYCAGLARRYARPLIPWMQAHTYGGPDGLRHVTPEDVRRMAEEQWQQGIDGVVWLGYSPRQTFPSERPDSWEAAAVFHEKLHSELPAKPEPLLAVLRCYRARALTSVCGEAVRNPADWLLQQLLEVWSVEHRLPYDVFELPPGMSPDERAGLAKALAGCDFVVATTPWDGAWTIGDGTDGEELPIAAAEGIRAQYRKELEARGWLLNLPERRGGASGLPRAPS